MNCVVSTARNLLLCGAIKNRPQLPGQINNKLEDFPSIDPDGQSPQTLVFSERHAMARVTRWIGAGALAGLFLGLAAPRAEAQFSIYARYGNALQAQNAIYMRYSALIKQGINPYYQ